MPDFAKLSPDLMAERLALPSGGPVRLLIDTDTANEIDDQFAVAWALLSPDKMTVEAVTAEPFSFAHHRTELLKAEAAIEAGTDHQDHQVGGFQGWIHRLHAQGRRAADLSFTMPPEGMELSYQEILTVYDKVGIASGGKVFRGAPRYMTAPDDIVESEAVDAIIDRSRARWDG